MARFQLDVVTAKTAVMRGPRQQCAVDLCRSRESFLLTGSAHASNTGHLAINTCQLRLAWEK